MKITNIETTGLMMPYKSTLRSHLGDATAGRARTIVRIETDEGYTGIGETQSGEASMSIIRSMKGHLIGEDPFNIEKIHKKFRMVPFISGYTGFASIAGVEMACWDIMGKATGRPLYQLIGGKYREKIPVSCYVHRGEPTIEEVIKFCEEAVKKYGFNVLKLKGGVYPPEHDIAALKAMRETFGPQIGLRIDPNAGWTAQTALRICKRLENLDLEYIEDPTWGLEAMARLKKDIRTPLSTNMCVVEFDHIPPAIRLGAVDIILADCHKWGGIWQTKKLASICETFKLGMSMHSGGELGVSTAAYLHIASSTPQLKYAIDSYLIHYSDDIIKKKFKIENGYIKVPSKPGLGVALDENKIKQYEEYYEGVKTTSHLGLRGVRDEF